MKIDLPPLPGGGILGITHAPGCGPGRHPRRGRHRPAALQEPSEQLPGMEAAVVAAGLAWHRMPIPDMLVPGPAALAAIWAADGHVVVQCAAGLRLEA